MDIFDENRTHQTTIIGHSKELENSEKFNFTNPKTKYFQTEEVPNKKGELKPRDNDSENKIFNTAHEFLGGNKNFRGRFTLFSERPLCPSYASVANQFQNY